MKKLISLLLSIVLLFHVSTEKLLLRPFVGLFLQNETPVVEQTTGVSLFFVKINAKPYGHQKIAASFAAEAILPSA